MNNDTTPAPSATPTEVLPTPEAQKSRGRPVDPRSSLTKAREVFASIPQADRTRKNAIAQFQTIDTYTGKLSKDTAAAYYSVIMRNEPKA